MYEDSIRCPICGSYTNHFHFSSEPRTLATLGWPKTSEDALCMQRFPLTYRRCLICTHIWNNDFEYECVPYEENANKMFNKGSVWQDYLKNTIDQLTKALPKNPTVIDVGCGAGEFISSLAAELGGAGRFIGFDPNGSFMKNESVEFFQKYFDPKVHIRDYKPDLIIMRHVLEHLKAPRTFIEELFLNASNTEGDVLFFCEVPCVDKAVSNFRIVDYFYEHPHQFTKRSLQHLLSLGVCMPVIELGYEDEVVTGLVSLKSDLMSIKNKSEEHILTAQLHQEKIKDQLSVLHEINDTIVIWGGTGKSAIFMQHYGCDPDRFPLVVDSDISKCGSYVPGVGTKIEHSSILMDIHADVVVITTSWRAKDILAEILYNQFSVQKIVIERNGQLEVYWESNASKPK